MIEKLLASLRATARDIVLAGIAASAGYLIGKEIPNSLDNLEVLIVGAVYAGLRGAVAYVVYLISK